MPLMLTVHMSESFIYLADFFEFENKALLKPLWCSNETIVTRTGQHECPALLDYHACGMEVAKQDAVGVADLAIRRFTCAVEPLWK